MKTIFKFQLKNAELATKLKTAKTVKKHNFLNTFQLFLKKEKNTKQ